MRLFIALIVTAAILCARAEEKYDLKYDSFDAEALASNRRLLIAYMKCFLDNGPCTAEGTEFKRLIPEAMETNCIKCSENQKDLIRIVVKAMQKKLPAEWAKLNKKYDPDGKYQQQFDDFLSEKGSS